MRNLSKVMHHEKMHARGSLQCINHPGLGPRCAKGGPTSRNKRAFYAMD